MVCIYPWTCPHGQNSCDPWQSPEPWSSRQVPGIHDQRQAQAKGCLPTKYTTYPKKIIISCIEKKAKPLMKHSLETHFSWQNRPNIGTHMVFPMKSNKQGWPSQCRGDHSRRQAALNKQKDPPPQEFWRAQHSPSHPQVTQSQARPLLASKAGALPGDRSGGLYGRG